MNLALLHNFVFMYWNFKYQMRTSGGGGGGLIRTLVDRRGGGSKINNFCGRLKWWPLTNIVHLQISRFMQSCQFCLHIGTCENVVLLTHFSDNELPYITTRRVRTFLAEPPAAPTLAFSVPRTFFCRFFLSFSVCVELEWFSKDHAVKFLFES